MPLYEYRCLKCGYTFEELAGKDDPAVDCKSCGSKTEKLMSSFSAVMSGGSTNESVDMSIGREADKRWQSHYDRQSKRRGDKELQNVPIPQTKDGKFMPVMALGDSNEKQKRSEYVDALQEHRKKRGEKGIPQFSGPGAF